MSALGHSFDALAHDPIPEHMKAAWVAQANPLELPFLMGADAQVNKPEFLMTRYPIWK